MPTLPLLLLATLSQFFLGANDHPPPAPPASLKPWVDYARALHADDACPPSAECVQFSRMAFHGRVTAGSLLVKVTGANLGRRAVLAAFFGPSSSFSLTHVHFTTGQGTVLLSDDVWKVKPQPGAFAFEAEVRFATDASLTLGLPSPVAHVVDALEQGSLTFDETSNQHGGTIFLQQEARSKKTDTVISTRVARSFTYGGTMTFTYRYAITGLREQTRMLLPLLGGEAIEEITPNLPYTVERGAPDRVAVTVTPAASVVTLTGHFVSPVLALVKPAGKAFEYWIFNSDARHPVEVSCDGVEIDAGEVKDLPITAVSRAFMLKDSEKLNLSPLAVNLDKGRQGSANATLHYRQGNTDTWLGDLILKLNTSPGTDRLVINTPAPAHFAAVSDRPVRMFDARGQSPTALSLRESVDGQALAPMRVQWREALSANAWLAFIKLQLPGQAIHLDEVKADVALRPGFVPLALFGAEHAEGDFFTGLHLYAILLALLGAVLARQARLPLWSVGALAIMLAGLYSVGAFPHVKVMALLAGTVVIVHLPASIFQRLAERRIAHRIVLFLWVGLCLSTAVHGVAYIQARLLSALHPWAMDAMLGGGDGDNPFMAAASMPGMGESAPAAASKVEPSEDEKSDEDRAPEGLKIRKRATAMPRPLARTKEGTLRGSLQAPLGSARLEHYSPQESGGSPEKTSAPAGVPQVREKTVLPVPFAPPPLPTIPLTYGFGSLPAGDNAQASLVLVGPCLRGLWMFAECAALAAIIGLLILKSRRLMGSMRGEVQP